MTTSVDIDFNKLEENIASLKNLLPRLDEPNFDKVEFWLSGTTGSGMVRDYLIDFCNSTITFHHAVYSLIENTATYLESVKKLKEADQNIANSL